MGATHKSSIALTSTEIALKVSLLPSEFRDVHLHAFARRTVFHDGVVRIDHPLPIIAIGSILKEAEHFSKLLSSGFSEAILNTHTPIRQFAYESEYDYESDSDLDEFEEPESTAPPIAGPSSSRGKGKARDESCEGSANTDLPTKVPDVLQYHQVLIPNIAHKTLMACVFYLYTGKVNFLPLNSQGKAERQFAMLTAKVGAAPACSSKSIYRLAESYGMNDLQELAYKDIISRLTPENIVTEAFSSFFARYDRLREHAVSYLSQHYSKPAVQNALPIIIDKIVLGEMPHAGGTLRSLLGLRVAVSITTPHEPNPSRSQEARQHVPTTSAAVADLTKTSSIPETPRPGPAAVTETPSVPPRPLAGPLLLPFQPFWDADRGLAHPPIVATALPRSATSSVQATQGFTIKDRFTSEQEPKATDAEPSSTTSPAAKRKSKYSVKPLGNQGTRL
ncbi:hypothetical protein C8Q76DRAFT_463336 [Earliella scabrosa]|nr:hypothetical protein C8Q76DRAFT_463336 [Earliella scabrosa]